MPVACPHCDALHASIVVDRGEDALCVRCGTALPLPRRSHSVQAGLAWAATALIAFTASVSMPLMGLSELGRATSTTLPMSAAVMWHEGDHASAAVIVACTIVAPALYLGLLLFVGVGALRARSTRRVGIAARWANTIAPWAMPEVMLLATLVTFVKVAQLAQASPGLGMYATAAVWGLMAAARNTLHLPSVWSRIDVREAAV
jgi:paraquat-inducible protein A